MIPDAGGHEVAPLGSRALLVRLGPVDPHAARQALVASPLPGQVEVTAGATTLTVRFSSARAARAGRAALAALRPDARDAAPGPLVTIDTVYDGDDLAEVAALTGLGVDGVIRTHTATQWHVAFVGFAPGFAYLRSPDATLHVPRRATPRVRVPAGAVALAGDYSAVYPRASPGGWQLVGHTAMPLWEPSEDPPLRLQAGDRVRFHAVRERVEVAEPARPALPPLPRDTSGLRVLATGAQTLIEDDGREGRSGWGVSRSGAADRGAFHQANRLVGNDPGAAAIEHAGGGLVVQAVGEVVVAVTGADAAVTVFTPEDELDAARATPFPLYDGEVLELGIPRAGLRSYVAVRGGIEAPRVLGSASTDTLAGLGVPPLAVDDELRAGPAPRAAVGEPEVPASVPGSQATVLELVPGPDDDWFDEAALTAFFAAEWVVTAQSNRVGLRLAGPPVARAREGELESQGLVPGAVQVPPSGQPVLFLADHPVTGGYPVIGVVADPDLDRAAQLPAGARMRFRRR
ncbi:5-oxoprolinase/urea amidolyase family protein [Microbacterium sp.]|uniref:5-oxoprolinase subunit B/C family protein n=1 Tax=Microbacterium sp. TaxID=51671 RepID=UPI0039E6348E